MKVVTINQNMCIGCGKCVADCVANNIAIKDQKAVVENACILCGHCVAICPVNAVSIPEYDMDDVEEFEKGQFTPDPDQVLRCLKFRRSIRRFKQTRLSKEDMFRLVQAGRYTATANNAQSSGYVFVQDELDTLKAMVWDDIDEWERMKDRADDTDAEAYFSFNRRRKADLEDDFLFRNAPVVLFLTGDRFLDAGLAAQNIETLAVSMGLGAMYNGFLVRIVEQNKKLKQWLGIEKQTIRACMLLGYPDIQYARTAPRKHADIIWK